MSEKILTPEIKKVAETLFKLIQDKVDQHDDIIVAEAIRDEWGDLLKTSEGFDILKFGEELTLTTSEQAKYGLEDSFRYMKDETAALLTKISRYVLKMVECWDFDTPNQNQDTMDSIYWKLIMIKNDAKKMHDGLGGLFEERAKSYRKEIENMNQRK